MSTQQINIGKRLQEVRSKYISAGKLTAIEFADLLGESRFNIANYERGIANIPNRVLVELYRNGINPTWVLTGEQEIYVSSGKNLKISNANKVIRPDINYFNEDDYNIIARAGDLLKIIADNRGSQA